MTPSERAVLISCHNDEKGCTVIADKITKPCRQNRSAGCCPVRAGVAANIGQWRATGWLLGDQVDPEAGPGRSRNPARSAMNRPWACHERGRTRGVLAGVHVGVASVAVGQAGRALAVPVHYSYQPGGLVTVLAGRRSCKAAAIRSVDRLGLCPDDSLRSG
jgi:hypothetical protein